MEIRILAGQLDGFVPDQRMHTEHRFPVEFYKTRFACRIDETKGVDAKAFHHREATRNSTIRHGPHDGVGGFRHHGNEIPERVVCRGGLRNLVVRLGLDGVNEVGKLDGVLNEKYRDVVSHQIEVAFTRVKPDRKATHVASGVGRAARTSDGGETREHGCGDLGVLQKTRLGEL